MGYVGEPRGGGRALAVAASGSRGTCWLLNKSPRSPSVTMKLGSKKASPLNDLDDVVLPVFAEYADDEEVERAAAQPLDEDEASIFWEDLRREASSRKKVYGSAEANRVERELLERFGRFKGVATHPWAVAAATRLEAAARTRLVGDPVLPLHTCVVILFMAYRGRMPRAIP